MLRAVAAAAQRQPAQALLLLVPDLALAVLSEACLRCEQRGGWGRRNSI